MTSLLVIMATVVLLLTRFRGRLLAGRNLARFKPNRVGRMTGENVLLGLVKVSLDREAGLTVGDESDDDDDADEVSPMFSSSIVLEAKVKSSSNSLKSAAATALATLPTAEALLAAAAAEEPAAEL